MADTKIEYIKEWISQLPPGNITYKTIKGRKYPYYQWTENGKQRNRVVKKEELEDLQNKILQRKGLQKQLKLLVASNTEEAQNVENEQFFSYIISGKELDKLTESVSQFKKRSLHAKLDEYLKSQFNDRVFILYGLRRTGKTTLMRQAIGEMDISMRAQTAFIQITPQIDLAKFNLDMRRLMKRGFRYIFIDEITLMEDFIENAAIIPDIFASSGMKIVLSGTDSLGFKFSEDQELYDRCFMVHTTFIPYREFENVLGVKGIDNYIKYGGTMSMGGVDYNKHEMTFASEASTNAYVDSSIAHNIQNSLKNYDKGGHFRNLYDLYQANELTSAINRIVEDINHRFTYEVLTKDFTSGDLSISTNNLLKDRNSPNNYLLQINKEQVIDTLKSFLEIKNLPEQKVEITDAHREEIKEYLDLLDITVDIDLINLNSLKHDKHTVITQPGMRYAQAKALVKSLLADEFFRELSLQDRNNISKRIMSDVMGRMMEEIVLLETKKSFPHKEVFKLIFPIGEFDMVIFDPDDESCSIYEIKHSKERDNRQYQHLIDEQKCQDTEFRYGTIKSKNVIYRGESCKENEINYINVEEYLNSLANK